MTFILLLALGSAAAGVAAAEDAQLRNGDPARWDEPILTSAQRLEASLKESRNALADALKECRESRSDRKACESDARAIYEQEVTTAKKQAADRPR
jgi:hypothetical protein